MVANIQKHLLNPFEIGTLLLRTPVSQMRKKKNDTPTSRGCYPILVVVH